MFFRTLKTGCRIESDQTHKSGRFEINLAFKLIVTWRILFCTMLCRQAPDVPCEVAFEEAEWKALWCYHHQTTQPPEHPPTLQEMTLLVARLGGYKQWNKNMEPGPQVLWKGFFLLPGIRKMWLVFNPKETVIPCFV